MGENRYKPFRDKKMSCIRVRRGSNKKDELYMGENASPTVEYINKLSFLKENSKIPGYRKFVKTCGELVIE